MEIRKIKILPEDEQRLRELLKIHEAEIDGLTEQELDEAEHKVSERLQRLLKRETNVRPLRFPRKTGAIAILAAAAAVLFVQVQLEDPASETPQLVSKGTGPAAQLSCDISIVQSDGKTPDMNKDRYEVAADQVSYLKLSCGKPVHVRVGVMQDGMLHLDLRDLHVSDSEKVVMDGSQRVNITAELRQRKDLMVLVSDKPIHGQDLSPKDLEGLWLDTVPLTIKP